MIPRRLALLIAGMALAACATPSGSSASWFKGNTHCHTLWDNGDALPEIVADGYRSRGYQFLVLSDHNEKNALTGREKWIDLPDPGLPEALARRFGPGWLRLRDAEGRRQIRLKTYEELRTFFDESGRFLLIPGQEIDDRIQGKLLHHNTINCGRILPAPGGGSIREAMARAIASVESEGAAALIHLNHPNLGWAVSAEDLAAVERERFFEVYSGHPASKIAGDGAHPGTERMWDLVLAARLRAPGGRLLYGVATDDAHDYHGKGVSPPGRGWIMVRAPALDASALVRAMDAGDFYASTGVTVQDLRADAHGLAVRVAAEATIRFIGTRTGGEAGVVLREVKGTEAAYAFTGDELYVRAVVLSDRPQPDPTFAGDLQKAWIQPVRGPAAAR